MAGSLAWRGAVAYLQVEQIAVLVGDWDHVTHIDRLHVSDPAQHASATVQQPFGQPAPSAASECSRQAAGAAGGC